MNLNPFRRKPDDKSNDGLLNAIVALASNQTPQTYQQYHSELLTSELYMAEDPEASPRPILLVDNDGGVIMPVFTDIARLKKTFPDATGYSAIPMQKLCQLVMSNDIHSININPEHGPGSFLQRKEIEALATGKSPEVPDLGQSGYSEPNLIEYGDPTIPTEDEVRTMTGKASLLLQESPHIVAAYLILLGSGNNDSKLTITLEFDEHTTQQQKTDFTRSFVPELEAQIGRRMPAKWLEGDKLRAVKKRVTPFYTRNS